LTYVPMLFLPKADDLSLAVQVQGGLARMASLDVYELKSIWPAGSGTPKAPKVPATAAQQIRRGTLGPPHNKP
jgi:hypothetical protein